jgi:hypothetical protein
MFLPSEGGDTPLYFFFNHLECKSTIVVDADAFADLIEEPIPEGSLHGEEQCPRHCVKLEDLETCENECHNAPFRRLFIDRMVKKNI